MNSITLKKLLPISAQELILSLLLKWGERLTLFPLIKKLNPNSKNLKKQKNNTVRTCNKCQLELPLNVDNYQIVKQFKEGYSFYCNECNKPKPKE